LTARKAEGGGEKSPKKFRRHRGKEKREKDLPSEEGNKNLLTPGRWGRTTCGFEKRRGEKKGELKRITFIGPGVGKERGCLITP